MMFCNNMDEKAKRFVINLVEKMYDLGKKLQKEFSFWKNPIKIQTTKHLFIFTIIWNIL